MAQAAATALVNIGVVWIVGALACRFWLRGGSARWRQPVLLRLKRVTTAALCLGVAGLALSLWTTAAAMADVPWPAAGPAFRQMLTDTHYGHAGLLALGVMVLALLLHLARTTTASEGRYLETGAALLLLFAGARAAAGHAYEHGVLGVAVESLHLLLVALWRGAVFVSGWLALPRIDTADSEVGRERVAYLHAMSRWATVALAGIILTGACNAFRMLGSPRHWLQGDYGHVLAVKLGFVLAAALLGAFNRFRSLPMALHAKGNAGAQSGLGIVIMVLRIESLALLLALLAAAVLTGSAPPEA